MTVTLKLSDLILACIIWTLTTALISHYGFGRTGIEVFTRVYYLLGGAFGAFLVGMIFKRRT